MKPKNPYVKSLRDPKGPYGKRVVQSKKIYTRKAKHPRKPSEAHTAVSFCFR